MKAIDQLKYYEVTSQNPIFMKLMVNKNKKFYHYTTIEAAKSIIQKKCLWVTQYNYLDDTEEIKYITEVLGGLITYLEDSKTMYYCGVKGEEIIFESIIKTLNVLINMYKKEIPIIGGSIFLLSLTNKKNNKYLWENYCKKDGAIIEFNTKLYDNFNKNNQKGIWNFAAKVIYDPGKQLTVLIEDINDFYQELIMNIVNEEKIDEYELIETIKSVLFVKVFNYSLFFKSHKFSKENEYRMAFLVSDDADIKYRHRSNKNIPYVEINFDDKAIRYVREKKSIV